MNKESPLPSAVSNRDLRKLEELLPVSVRIATLARLLGSKIDQFFADK